MVLSQNRWQRLLKMLEGNGNCTVTIIRNMSCQHLKEHDTHSIDVTLNSSFRPSGLLWRQVVD